jgi:hypothetical protein
MAKKMFSKIIQIKKGHFFMKGRSQTPEGREGEKFCN